MAVVLRATRASDLALLLGGESEFDDFGPVAERAAPPPARLDGDGGLTICTAEAQEPAGHLDWHWQQWGPNAGSRGPMIGIWLRPEHRGRGLGREAQAALVELFFVHTAANRVEAHTDVDNVAEQRALEAAGFTREGVLRGAQWRSGAYHDMVSYAIVRGDPRPAR